MADINLKANLNRSDVTMGLQELTSQLGMALGQATGFGTAATQMAGSPNMLGGAFGSTFTDARMAYSPHYGQIHAATTMAQEQAVQQRGLSAAQELKPPGVAPAAFAMAAMTNSIERDAAAREQASSAARAAFYTSAGGLAGGMAAGVAGGWAGAKVGAAMGARFFGAGGAAAGAAIGGLAGNWFGFDAGMDFTGGKIENHFAKVEQIGGVTRELGEIAGGGRGMGREGRYDLGIAARKAAGDLKMDVQQMGDILAVGREAGMLPSSKDPGKAREQYRDYARAIEEGAQVLQSSLASATQVVKQATSQGMSATEGISRAAGAGGADVWLQQQSRMNAFGNAGAAAGRGMGFTGAQGRGVYMGGLGATAGLSGEEQKIMGGRFGVGAFVGQAQMAMAASPMGDIQMMAAMGGQAGGSMMNMPGAALAGLTANGDDLMTGMMNFTVNKDRYRRGIGTKGVQAMARQQMEGGAEMLESMGMGGTAKTRQAFFAMNQMGLTGVQARALVGGSGGGGGGGGGRGNMGAQEVAKMAMDRQATDLGGTGALSEAEIQAQVDSSPSGFGFGEAISGGVLGGLMGAGAFSIPGAALGAGIGFVSQNAGAIKSMFSDGPGLFASASVKADYYRQKSNRAVDAKVKAAQRSIGFVNTNEDEITRALDTNLTGARMNLDAEGSPRASKLTGAMLIAAGLETVDPNSDGVIKVDGEYYNAREAQKIALQNPGITKKERARGAKAAFTALTSKEQSSAVIERKPDNWWEAATGAATFDSINDPIEAKKAIIEQINEIKNGSDPKTAAQNYARLVKAQIARGGDEGLKAQVREGGLKGGAATAFVSSFTGESVESLRAMGVSITARGLGAGFEGVREASIERLGGFLNDAMGGGSGTISREQNTSNETAGYMLGKLTRGPKSVPLAQASKLVDEYWAHAGKKEWQDKFDKYDLDDLYKEGQERGKVASESIGGSPAMAKRMAMFVRDSGLGRRITEAGTDPKLRSQIQRDFDKEYRQQFIESTADEQAAMVRQGATTAPDLYKRREIAGQYKAPFDMRDPGNQPSNFNMEAESGGVGPIIADAKKAVLGVATTTIADEFAEQVKVEGSEIGSGKPKKKRRGGGLQNAAGFGASESAMSTISKTLRHQERLTKTSFKEADIRLKKLESKG